MSTSIEEQISRSFASLWYASSRRCLCTGRTWQWMTKALEYKHRKAGAICSARKACTTIYITIAQELHCIGDQGRCSWRASTVSILWSTAALFAGLFTLTYFFDRNGTIQIVSHLNKIFQMCIRDSLHTICIIISWNHMICNSKKPVVQSIHNRPIQAITLIIF